MAVCLKPAGTAGVRSRDTRATVTSEAVSCQGQPGRRRDHYPKVLTIVEAGTGFQYEWQIAACVFDTVIV